MMNTRFFPVLALAAMPLASCKKQASTGVPASVVPASFFLVAEPADAKAVEDVKHTAKVGERVAVRGRVGGGEAPFVAGRGLFTLVGAGLPSCSDNPDDHCPTPWDYCCETSADVAAHSVTVQVVGADGKPLRADVKGAAGVKELSELVVVGTVAQAEGEVFVVHATAAFVAKP